MDKPKTLKEANKVLMGMLKNIYPAGRLVYYSEEHNHILVKPFKKARDEFEINLEDFGDGEYCITRWDDYDQAMEDGGVRDENVKRYPMSGIGNLQEGFNYQKIIEALKKAIADFVKGEQKFYDEGVDIHIKFGSDKKEAKELAGIIYRPGYLKELGIK